MLRTTLFSALFTTLAITIAYRTLVLKFSPRINDKAKYLGHAVEYYLTFKNGDSRKSAGVIKGCEWRRGEVNFNEDALEVLEYRHDWASFGFTMGNFRFLQLNFFLEFLLHSRSQGVFSQFSVFIPLVNWPQHVFLFSSPMYSLMLEHVR